jgi:3-methyl-2-oxobutanoate hydroxymethyltransferase
MSDKVTAPIVRGMKDKGAKIVVVTAYDAPFGEMADEAGVDVVLVGDSLGNVVLGYPSTLPVSLDDMVHHTAATARGVKRALIVADMPFGSYQSSPAQAVDSAIRLVKAGAEAVKLEGAYTAEVKAILKAGIPVMGHVGMTPQSVNKFGGHRVQGKGDGAQEVLDSAAALDEAGVFSMVLELVPSALAQEVTRKVSCPTIGIGAGPYCDGQVQVLHDMLGLSVQKFRHAKRYAEGREAFVEALRSYASEVRDGGFPGSEHSI